MRTIRGLQITSIVVLSPVLLLLISLIWMLCISIFKSIVSTPPTDSIIIQQQQRSFHPKYPVKKSRFFTKLRQSPITPCVIILLYALYILFKKQKREEPVMIKQEPKTTKKHSKRRKVLKKKKRLEHVTPTTAVVNHTQQPTKEPVKRVMPDSPTPSCTTPKFDKTKVDLNLISPESTPLHSEDEMTDGYKQNNWYSPFLTGLDLDIIPKFTHPDPSPIFTTNHFKHTVDTPTPIPSTIKYIPTLVLREKQESSPIQLLEMHPYIPPPSTLHPIQHAFGSIGDERKNQNLIKK